MDKRFFFQVFSLVVLAALPVVMIVVNGAGAVQAILKRSPTNESDLLEPNGDAPTNTSEPKHALQFGVYDPNGIFSEDESLKIRHAYVSWSNFDSSKLQQDLHILIERGIAPLLTVEPWPAADLAGEKLLKDIVEGSYDQAIDEVAAALSDLDGRVYVSWGHEMDQDLTERYPWSGKEPAEYVAAYRYVVDRIREQVQTDLHWVWSGVLKDGSLRYWPGDEYADSVGMPIYSFPKWDRKAYGFIRDFRKVFEEKQEIVSSLDKPLMITELGVSGDLDFESFWIHQAFLSLDNYRNLEAVIFFHARDSEGAWGADLPTPDWRMHPDTIRSLVEWKQR